MLCGLVGRCQHCRGIYYLLFRLQELSSVHFPIVFIQHLTIHSRAYAVILFGAYLLKFLFIPDEEIDAVRLELKKYGIKMPAFQKIGGILANDLAPDSAVLHAAIIAINEAIDRKVLNQAKHNFVNSFLLTKTK
jgi:hypothetical protein